MCIYDDKLMLLFFHPNVFSLQLFNFYHIFKCLDMPAHEGKLALGIFFSYLFLYKVQVCLKKKSFVSSFPKIIT